LLREFFEEEEHDNWKAFKSLALKADLNTYQMVSAQARALDRLKNHLLDYIEQKNLVSLMTIRQQGSGDEHGQRKYRQRV